MALWPLTRPGLVGDNEADFCHGGDSLSVCDGRSARGRHPISLKQARETGSGFADGLKVVVRKRIWVNFRQLFHPA